MCLFAYYCLLLFFGCASTLFTAALPVTDTESMGVDTLSALVPRVGERIVAPPVTADSESMATHSSSALVPRAVEEIKAEWTLFGRRAIPIDQNIYTLLTELFQKAVETSLRQYIKKDLRVSFTGAIAWNLDSQASFHVTRDAGAPFIGLIALENDHRQHGLHYRLTFSDDPDLADSDAKVYYTRPFVIPNMVVVTFHSGAEAASNIEAVEFKRNIIEFFSVVSPEAQLTEDLIKFSGAIKESQDRTTQFYINSLTRQAGALADVVKGEIQYKGKYKGRNHGGKRVMFFQYTLKFMTVSGVAREKTFEIMQERR
ncbi:hypothetical protein C8R42DRAFT_646981 [Lentinula raphanica]|nr:hypothetical protein C8R42DRAFT_646981 [Lentinula raphanica]